ncbi:hypothetical protein D1872_291280 [compost metagenome]
MRIERKSKDDFIDQVCRQDFLQLIDSSQDRFVSLLLLSIPSTIIVKEPMNFIPQIRITAEVVVEPFAKRTCAQDQHELTIEALFAKSSELQLDDIPVNQGKSNIADHVHGQICARDVHFFEKEHQTH